MLDSTPLLPAGTRFLCLAAAIACGATAVAGEPGPPNLLLIVADDLGFSDLGCYGGEIDTPHLDRLAAGGLRLTQFYTTGRCCPSRAALFTGRYPHAVGLGHMTKDLGPDRPGYRGRLAEGTATLADRLAARGYRTFLSGKWHLGTPDPTAHGFEAFHGTLASAKTFWEPDHFLSIPATAAPRANGRNGGTGESDEPFYGTRALTDAALGFLEEADETPERPWFLTVAYHAPHFPLQAPPGAIAKYAGRYAVGWDAIRERRLERMKAAGILPADAPLTPRSDYYDWGESEPAPNPAWDALPADRRADLARRMAIYAAMVDRLDRNVGRLLAALEGRGETGNTLVVFTSDNGACAEWDPFGFDGESGPGNVLHTGAALAAMGSPGTFHSAGSGWANASNAPWRMYKHHVHEGGIAAPCVVRWPGRVAGPGRIDATPAHLIDLLPTLLDAATPGAAGPPEPAAGESLLPLLHGEPLPDRRLYFEHEGNRAVRTPRWKLVALRGRPWELYDMTTDRAELHDRAAERPALVGRLAADWDRWAAGHAVTPLPENYGVEYVPAAGESE